MATKVITNVDTGSVEIRDGEFRDSELTFAGAGTYAAGTLLGVATAAPAGPYLPWASGAADGTEVAVAVLTYAVEATGAGDVPARVLVAGVVNQGRLLENATGDASNVTEETIRQLQDNKITALVTDQLGRVDNPQP